MEKCCCRTKDTPRSEEQIRNLKNRLNRISGQINGISNMLDENRYCGDILIQLSAVESALQNLGYMILKDHLETCVSEKIASGDEGIYDETIELIRKLK